MQLGWMLHSEQRVGVSKSFISCWDLVRSFRTTQWLFTTCTFSIGIASASIIKSGIIKHPATMRRRVRAWVKQGIIQPPWVAAVVWVVWRPHHQGFQHQARDHLLWTITVEVVEQERRLVVVVLHHPWHVVETTGYCRHNLVDWQRVAWCPLKKRPNSSMVLYFHCVTLWGNWVQSK